MKIKNGERFRVFGLSYMIEWIKRSGLVDLVMNMDLYFVIFFEFFLEGS